MYTKRRLLTRNQLEKVIAAGRKKYASIYDDRKLLADAYDYNFAAIQASEKESKLHKMLLIIENALNNEAMRLVKSYEELSQRIDRNEENIVKGKYRMEEKEEMEVI